MCAQTWRSDGCAVLKGFIRADAMPALVAEAEGGRRTRATALSAVPTPISPPDDPSLPDSHPARRFFDRSNNFIPADNFRADGPLRQIQDFPRLRSVHPRLSGARRRSIATPIPWRT
jgi:hypothetical protein